MLGQEGLNAAVRYGKNTASSSRKIRVSLVENDPFAMESIGRLLPQCSPRISVAQRFEDGLHAIEFFETHDNVADVIVMDMHLNDIEGPSVTWQIRRVNDYTPILAVTSLPLGRYRFVIAQAGAQGLLPKKNLEGIAATVLKLNAGQTCEGFDAPNVASRRIQRQFRSLMVLTPMQTHVIELLAQGLDDKAIARHLHCATATVRKHRQNILQRLDAGTTMEAVIQWRNLNRMLNLES